MSLIKTKIVEVIEKGNLDKYELRGSLNGTYDLFVTQTNTAGGIITSQLQSAALQSDDDSSYWIGPINATIPTQLMFFNF